MFYIPFRLYQVCVKLFSNLLYDTPLVISLSTIGFAAKNYVQYIALFCQSISALYIYIVTQMQTMIHFTWEQ